MFPEAWFLKITAEIVDQRNLLIPSFPAKEAVMCPFFGKGE